MTNNFFIYELGFNQLKDQLPDDLQGKGISIDKVHYSGNLPAVFFKEVKSFEIEVLKDISELQRKIWNNSSVIFLYVTSPTEIRIYNCNDKPVWSANEDKLKENLSSKLIEKCTNDDKATLEKLKHVFSSIAIDSGSIWTSEYEYAKRIKLQNKVDSYLVSSLLNLTEALYDEIDDENVIHSLLMRSIFIMYLQDRRAIPQVIWDTIGSNNFLEILEDHNKTYQLFEIINSNFNGNTFPILSNEQEQVTQEHLKYLKNCLTDGDINSGQKKLFDGWRLFDFSLIRIEMLSEIYENFLGKLNQDHKKDTGTYYTPPSLVELILNDVLPTSEIDFIYNKKILDPAYGSGIFLTLAYKRIVKRWVKSTGREASFNDLKQLLIDNIYGVEIDTKSIKVAAFSLYLSLLDFLEPKDVWLQQDKQFPHLIYDENSENPDDKKGGNLFRADTIEKNGKFETIKYDLIIGNPPFGTNKLKKNVKDYCEKYSYDKQYVIPFIHKTAKLLSKGKIALLFNTKILTNNKSTAQNFRKWLFNENYVEKIFNLSILRQAPKNFGGQLFSSATTPVSIIIFQNEFPENQEKTIEYWAPTSFIKNHVAEGVVIDHSDIKYLPREICQQPDSKIWKIAQWGNLSDYYLVNRLKKNGFIKEILDSTNNGVGFQLLDSTTEKPIINEYLKEIQFILPEGILRYKTPEECTTNINHCIKTTDSKKYYQKYYSSNEIPLIDVFRRIGNINSYKSPHILIKEGLKQNRVCASYLNFDCSFNSKVYGIHLMDSSLLKTLTCYFNSSLASYYLFLYSASWGIEREEIKPNDIKNLPKLSEKIDLSRIFETVESDIFTPNLLSKIEKTIDEIIFDSFDLTTNEKVLIRDFVDYKQSLFFDGENSIALRPLASLNPETITYMEMVCSELNDFLGIGELKLNARSYKVSPHTPLCIVILQFVNKDLKEPPQLIAADIEFQQNLKMINEFTLYKYAQNVYTRKQVRYYKNNAIYIIKPNQKRFWTRSQAIDDTCTIINELSLMKDDE
jgi:type I restriction-modification system DNA methylase subunit